MKTKLPKTFEVKYNPEMKCAQSEAEQKKYRQYKGKSGNTWLVAEQPNSADDIYVTNDHKNSGGEGFGGSTLSMPLINGKSKTSHFMLHGGWKSNSDSFFEDTGIDIRGKHRTFGAVGTGLEWKNCNCVVNPIFQHEFITGIKHIDMKAKIGKFNRIELIAQNFANRLKKPVVYYSQSEGGSVRGWANPKTRSNKHDAVHSS